MSKAFSKRWTREPEYIDLLNYLINKTKNAKSPININQLIRDFKEKSGTALTEKCFRSRIDKMRAIIHSFEHIDTETKVRMLFVLSVPVNGDFLKKLHNDALVEVDEKNRITVYKSECLELKGYHGLSRGDTKNYWKTDPEYINLLNFLIERTKNVKSPMNSAQLVRDFKEKSGTALTVNGLRIRIDKMRAILHSFDHIVTDTKVRMLFALSAPVNRDFLQKLSRNALVEVDENDRITHYKSERLELKGCHILSTARDTKHYWTTDIESINLLNYLIEKTENVKSPMNVTGFAKYFKEKSGALQAANSLEHRILRLRTIIHSFDHIDTNTKVKLLFALSGSVDADFLEELKERAIVEVDKQNRITYYEAIKDGLELSGDHSLPVKRSSKRTHSSPNLNSLDLQVDYDPNYSIEDQVKLEPFCGSVQEDLNGIVDDKDIQQIPEPIETPIKIEVEEPVELKPETFHNSKAQFFEAMQSLIVYLDTPSLSRIQSKIHQKIQMLEESDKVILNNEIVQIVDSLISRMSTSVVNLSETAESVYLSNFLCCLKAAILNSKMSGVDDLVLYIIERIQKSQNKRVPMENVVNALRATLDFDRF